MAAQITQRIALENLLIDLKNPRSEEQVSQREAIAEMALDQDAKLVTLAEDILEQGLNPSELPIVIPGNQPEQFIVVEGNRRITALKLVKSPDLLASINLPKNVASRFKALQEAIEENFPHEILCTVMESRGEASRWIELKHTGENRGVGVVPWDGVATQRFRGGSAALQAIDIVDQSTFIDDSTREKLPKIAITTVERLLSTPDARTLLGVEIVKGSLVLPEDEAQKSEAIGRLSMVISDIANKKIKVTQLDSKDQRVEYARSVANAPLPQPVGASVASSNGSTPAPTNPSSKSKSPRLLSPERTTLIPKKFKVTISHTRLNEIFNELRTLKIDDFTNSCAVMLRVFLELSVDQYGKANGVVLTFTPTPSGKSPAPPPGKLKTVDLSLKQKLKAVANQMEANGVCSASELRGIRELIANAEHVLSVESLNACVHNMSYNPNVSDLKKNWDSIEVFISKLWA